MKTATLATAASLLAAASAAHVTLKTTKCIDDSVPYGEVFDIDVNTPKPVAKDLPQICGIEVVSISDGLELTMVRCKAFKDAEGTVPGSATFDYYRPALISTNPVSIKSINCGIPIGEPGDNPGPSKRQVNNGTVAVSSSAVFTSVVTASSIMESSIVTRTAVVTSGVPVSSSGTNATQPSNTLQPSLSASQTNTPNAAGKISVGMGVVLGAVVAMFV